MLKWFDLISDMSVTIIAVAGTDIWMPRCWKSHNEEENMTCLVASLTLIGVFHHFIKKRKKPTTYCSIWWLTGSWTVKTLFSNTFFRCFSIPTGPCYNSWPSETPWLSFHRAEQIFKQSPLAVCIELPSRAAGMPVGGSDAEFTSHILDTSFSPHSPSLQSPLFPASPPPSFLNPTAMTEIN